jgi:hypothetical protein
MERFDWSSTGINLEALIRSYSFSLAKSRRRFVAPGNLPDERIVFVPPAVQPILPTCQTTQDYLESLPSDLGEHLVILMRSGHGCLGIGSVDELNDVKAIRRYTVRKSQGKSQSALENKKKVRSAGSQLRRRETTAFFVELASELMKREKRIKQCQRIFIASPVRLWPELFAVKQPLPFKADDPRLIKVALDIKTPNREGLDKFNLQLGRGYWAIDSPAL